MFITRKFHIYPRRCCCTFYCYVILFIVVMWLSNRGRIAEGLVGWFGAFGRDLFDGRWRLEPYMVGSLSSSRFFMPSCPLLFVLTCRHFSNNSTTYKLRRYDSGTNCELRIANCEWDELWIRRFQKTNYTFTQRMLLIISM